MNPGFAKTAVRWLSGQAAAVIAAISAATDPLAAAILLSASVVVITASILLIGRAYTRLKPGQQRAIVNLIRAVRGRPADRS